MTDNRTGMVLVLIVAALMVMAIAAAVLFFRLLAKFKPVHDQLAPFGAKAAFWGAIAYTVLPIDVLPDPFMGDDVGMLALALFYINKVLAAMNDADSVSANRTVIDTTGINTTADNNDPGDDPGEERTDIIGR